MPYIVKRTLAAAMDYGLCFALFLAYTRVFGEANEQGAYVVHGCLHFMVMLAVWFLMFPLPEAVWGRGIGKAVCNLRVVMQSRPDTRPTLAAVAKRQLTAFFEVGMCLGILPLIVIFSTPARQRLGDLWAGTIVVEE